MESKRNMADRFDPYKLWLGIHPDEQPPNYYRLLGIRLYESDGEIIESAASRQRASLKQHTSGRYAKTAEKLREQMAAARACLLSPDRKDAYDEKLKKRLQGDSSTGKPAVKKPAPKASSPPPRPEIETSSPKPAASPFDFDTDSSSVSSRGLKSGSKSGAKPDSSEGRR
ncbi:unnamed protein product, partial [marine sediment metagenome]